VPIAQDFAPKWLVDLMEKNFPHYAVDGSIVALDIEVLEPGVIRLKGCWPDENTAIVITDKELIFCTAREKPIFVSLFGGGRSVKMTYTGPITSAFFGFGEPSAPNRAALNL
jgi:hypothetical protein